MGTKTHTITINVCDRCGSEHNQADYMKGNQWGQMNVGWRGDIGGRAYDGSAGGNTIEGKAWLCLPCTEGFLAFMQNKGDTASGRAQRTNNNEGD